MKIAVDIDDTLNIVERLKCAKAYIERKGLPFHLGNPDSNKYVEIFDWTLPDVLHFVREEGGVASFTDAAARKGAKEALTCWREMGHEVIILTARLKEWFSNPERLSRDWLEKRRIPYDALVAGVSVEDKGRYCLAHGISILVDDDIEACLNAQQLGVRAVLAIGRHNAHRAREIYYGGANWQQIDAAVKHILQERI